MVEAVEVQLYPSCYPCLAWSADGDLAVAVGEYIHILTPKIQGHSAALGSSTEKSTSAWVFTRVRTNVFTQQEWEQSWPSNRDHFSIGAEQSNSQIASLSWSWPGIAKHRRCLLGILTSNLLLSFYEAIGDQRKWTRIAVLNKTLEQYFLSQQGITDQGLLLRKKRVRAFAWCPPLKESGVAARHKGASDDVFPSPELRWGRQLLAIANDDKDLIIVQIRRRTGPEAARGLYSMEVISHISADEPRRNFPMVPNGSLYAAEIEARACVTHVSCGPWIRPSSSRSRAIVGIIHGSHLRLINLEADTNPSKSGSFQVRMQKRTDFPSPKDVNFTGPLEWVSNSSISLVAGIFAGRCIICLSEAAYINKKPKKNAITVRQRQCLDERGRLSHWEPLSAITTTIDKDGRPHMLHMSTLGNWAESLPCSAVESAESANLKPDWKKQRNSHLQRFDIDNDLGGLAVARTWGLASFRRWIAAAFTMHPGDMVEYMTSTNEKTTIVFASDHAFDDHTTTPPVAAGGFLMKVPELTTEHIQTQRARVLEFTLRHHATLQDSSDIESGKTLYAAAACAIVAHHQDKNLLSWARKALERLVSIFTAVDFSDELSKCDPTSSPPPPPSSSTELSEITIGPRPSTITTILSSPERDLFENCDMCGSGLTWFSAEEAQCAEGHLFVRCALTFLAIQEPGITKICSVCETEFLDPESISESANNNNNNSRIDRNDENDENDDDDDVIMTEGVQPDKQKGKGKQKEKKKEKEKESGPSSQSIYDKVLEYFDTCPYCGGKFQD